MKVYNLVFLLFLIPMSHGVDFKCKFKDYYWENYKMKIFQCNATLPSITERNVNLTLTSSNLRLADVKFFELSDQKVEYLPQNILEIFPNVEWIGIWRSGLREIRPNDLKPFENLRFLSINQNLIEYLEEDLFKFNLKLEYIDLNNNKISHISPRLFDDLPVLRTLLIYDNLCIDHFASNRDKVLKMSEKIIEKCQDPANILKIISEGLFEEIDKKAEELRNEIILRLNNQLWTSDKEVELTSRANIIQNDESFLNFVLIPFAVLLLIFICAVLLITCQCIKLKSFDEEEEIIEEDQEVETTCGTNQAFDDSSSE